MMRGRGFAAAVLIGYLLLYLLPLGGRPLVVPDETRYAEIPREMLASGDYVVPHMNGLRYFEKPALGYWCTALSMRLFGENRFAVRLPSALAAGASGLLVFLLVARFGAAPSALFAAVVFLLSIEVFVVGVVNVLDGVFSLWISAALSAFLLAYHAEGRRRALYLVAMGLACGLAFLTKGFLAFALPAVVIAPFLLWERRWRQLLTMPWVPLATAVLVILPWALAIHGRESDFWHYFVWIEHLKRFASPEAQHTEPVWFFLPVLIGGALPWTPLFPAAVRGLRTRPATALTRYAICWFLACFAFFTVSKGKLGTYILPCFPPLAILTAGGLFAYLHTDGRKALVGGVVAMAMLAAAVCVALVGYRGELDLDVPSGSLHLRRLVLAAAFAVWSALALLAARSRAPVRAAALYCTGTAIALFTFHAIAGGLYQDSNMPGRFLTEQAQQVTPRTILVSDGHRVAAVC